MTIGTNSDSDNQQITPYVCACVYEDVYIYDINKYICRYVVCKFN